MEARTAEAERNANAALNLGFSTTFVLGPALGGALVAAVGAPTALFVDVGSFLIGGALLRDLHPHVENAGGDSVQGTAALRPGSTSTTRRCCRRLFMAEFAGPAVHRVGSADRGHLRQVHTRRRATAASESCWPCGAPGESSGSIVFARLVKWPLRILLSGGAFGIAMAYLGLAGAPSLLPACLAGIVGGIGNGMQWPSLISAVQRLTPEDLHGRLMGAAESLGALCVAIGLPLGGLLVALSSPRAAFIAVGIGALLGGLALLQVRIAGTRPSETAETGVESTIPPAPIRSAAEQIPN